MTFDPEDVDPGLAEENIKALMNVVLPAEWSPDGQLLSPGALEAGAYESLHLESFLPLAQALGLLPDLPTGWDLPLGAFDPVLAGLLSAQLDVIAFQERPLTPFRNLNSAAQRRAVERAIDDPQHDETIRFLRGVVLLAYLGAIHSDVGLRHLGFPAFENFEDGLAVSGYPRTKDGRLVDAENENLEALAAANNLDDYTYNRLPAITAGDDISDVVSAQGEFF